MTHIFKIILIFIILIILPSALSAARIRSWETGNAPVFSDEKTPNHNSPKKYNSTQEELENRIEILESQINELTPQTHSDFLDRLENEVENLRNRIEYLESRIEEL